MNILIAINQSRVLYDFKRELVLKLLERGHRVLLSYEEDFRAPFFAATDAIVVPTPIDPRGVAPSKDVRLYFFYRRLLKKWKPDLALTFTIKPNVYCCRACRSLGIPCLATISGFGAAANAGGALQLITTILYRVGLRGARSVFCQNETIARAVVEQKMTSADRVVRVSGSGVDLVRFQPTPYPDEKDAIELLFVGRLMRDKGIDELLEVARRFKSRRSDVRFALLGARERGCDDVYERVLAAAERGTIAYFGYAEDDRARLSAASAIVLPSYHEGLSNALLEAAASARPVLASRVPGCVETFEEGVSGLAFEPKDPDDQERAIEMFLSIPREERAEMGRRGREKVEREFSREKVVERYVEEIERA